MNKHEERSLTTRNRLIESTWLMLKEKSIQQISIKELTEKAGVYRSTFYLHFLDVYDLFEQMENQVIQEWQMEILSKASKKTSDTDLIDLLSSFYEEKGDKVFLLLKEKNVSQFEIKMKQIMRPFIREQLNQVNEKEFDYLFEFCVDGILGVLTKWYLDKENTSIKEVIAISRHILQQGVYPKTETTDLHSLL